MKNLVLPLYLLLTLISCTKEIGVTGPAGPQGPAGTNGTGPASDTGTIAGQISLYDEFSYPQNNAAGAIVTLTSGSLQLTDTTNAAGQYHFAGMKTGTYDLRYQKNGYGTMKVFGVSHFGGGQLPTTVNPVYLVQVPQKTAPDSLSITANTYQYTYFTMTLDTSSLQYEQYMQNILIFISKDKNVSFSHYSVEMATLFSPNGIGGYINSFSKSGTSPFKTGDTLYAVGYTYNRYVHPTASGAFYTDAGDGGYYVDPQTGQFVFPNISRPTNIEQFVY